jgi:SM-20-related protein
VRLEVYDSFFPPSLLLDLNALVSGTRWKPGWYSNRKFPVTQFNVDFGKATGKNRDDISGRLTNHPELIKAWGEIQTRVLRVPHALLRCYANLNVYGTEGYPHKDSKNPDDITTLVYLCGAIAPDDSQEEVKQDEGWKLEYGGETVIAQNGDIVKAVLPRENRLLVFSSNMTHAARGVTRACTKPRITLMFKSTPNGNDFGNSDER